MNGFFSLVGVGAARAGTAGRIRGRFFCEATGLAKECDDRVCRFRRPTDAYGLLFMSGLFVALHAVQRMLCLVFIERLLLQHAFIKMRGTGLNTQGCTLLAVAVRLPIVQCLTSAE